jgi:hypothetical protein
MAVRGSKTSIMEDSHSIWLCRLWWQLSSTQGLEATADDACPDVPLGAGRLTNKPQ